MNYELNKMPQWIKTGCALCEAKYPYTVLNIEGAIHHAEPAKCLDQRACRRRQRKLKS